MTTRATGASAEGRAASHLERLGYRIVARNYRIRQGEIDLVAQEGETLCFVEVRSRSRLDHGTPEETISRTKRRRIATAAEHYLAFRVAGPAPRCRFDVVAIDGDGDGEIRLIRDAFRLEDC